MNNPDKVIDALTEKIERLENDVLFARLERDRMKTELAKMQEKMQEKMHPVRLPNIHKETRPAAEKAEEIR